VAKDAKCTIREVPGEEGQRGGRRGTKEHHRGEDRQPITVHAGALDKGQVRTEPREAIFRERIDEMKRLATQRGGRITPQVVDALLGAERWRAVEHAGIDLGKEELSLTGSESEGFGEGAKRLGRR
jgi:hypothetical protein